MPITLTVKGNNVSTNAFLSELRQDFLRTSIKIETLYYNDYSVSFKHVSANIMSRFIWYDNKVIDKTTFNPTKLYNDDIKALGYILLREKAGVHEEKLRKNSIYDVYMVKLDKIYLEWSTCTNKILKCVLHSELRKIVNQAYRKGYDLI